MRFDNVTSIKASKGEDFDEHKNILEKALAENPCTGGRERGMNTTGKRPFFFFQLNQFSDLMNTLSKCQHDIGNCAAPLTRLA